MNDDQDPYERLRRVARRAREERAAALDEPGRLGPDLPPIGNLCSEIDMTRVESRSVALDPAATADAMMDRAELFGRLERGLTSRTLGAFRRAHAEASHDADWGAAAHPGETLLQTMTRVIAEGLPTTSLSVVRGPSMEDMRAQFDALPPAERADEIERHRWACASPDRVRTRFAPLLSALGIR